MPGLGKLWPTVIQTLSKSINYYRALNSAISFGRDVKVREDAAERLRGLGVLLDLGAGEGLMTEIVLWKHPEVSLVVMLDALPKMLKAAEKREKAEKLTAVFEHIPLRDGCCEEAVAAFALRDAMDLEKGLGEVARVLKDGGLLTVLDLAKPDSLFKRTLITFYWTVVAPLAALLKLGRKGAIVVKILSTYLHLPPTSKLKEIYSRFFEKVELEEMFMGGVIILKAWKRGGALVSERLRTSPHY